MSDLLFKKLETFHVPECVAKEQESDPEHVLKKVRAAFNLCWELPQVVLDRLFSSASSKIDDSDTLRVESVLSKSFGFHHGSAMQCCKYFAFPRFRSNVCLKVVTAFLEESRLFLAIFSSEARPVENESELDRILPAHDLPFAYAIQLSTDCSEVTFHVSSYDNETPGASTAANFGLTPGWFQYGMVKKLTSWLINPEFEVAPSDQPRSMRLVDPEIYLSTYLTLKDTIGSYWIKNWPERTDPQKFVYEELAIAAYLLTILRQTKIERTSFADLGCGNGFLTFALNTAKFPDLSISGIGIDMRKRKIWDVYPDIAGKLREAPVTADNLEQFDGAEWFVGNHSDELTPWIPYIASKCGPNSKVFLLPCCPFDFHSKYKHRVGGKSLYAGYLDFIEKLCVLCGFEVQRDRLRIPSTKRVCFVCTKRADLPPEIAEKYRVELAALVGESGAHASSADPLVPKAPEVKNCTAIASDLKQLILSEVFAALLSKCSEDVVVVKLRNGENWNAGGGLPLNEAIQFLSAKSVDALKDQDGGLKTFVKNYSHIFAVIKGSVYFKAHPTAVQFLATRHKKPKPTNNNQSNKPAPASERPCWFEAHHPDGCPYWPVGDVCRSHHVRIYPNTNN